MIYFTEIFDRAVTLFDDPDFSVKYYFDRANFCRDMLDFLIIGKNKFMSPVSITDKLVTYDAAEGYTESDSGTGSATYVLEHEVAQSGVGVGFTYTIGTEKVVGSYNATDNSVTFPREVAATETWTVEWFYAGAFTADFSDCLRSDFPLTAILDKVINILAYALLSAWGDKEVGRVLEVRNILTDTDFKMYSPANSAKAKVAWRD